MTSHPPNLSGEQHIGAAGLRLNEETEKVKKNPAARSEEGPRKRAKKSAKPVVTEVEEDYEDDEDAGVDEESKRARGRPRLDTKDQNAAEVGSWSFVVSNLPSSPPSTTILPKHAVCCVPTLAAGPAQRRLSLPFSL